MYCDYELLRNDWIGWSIGVDSPWSKAIADGRLYELNDASGH